MIPLTTLKNCSDSLCLNWISTRSEGEDEGSFAWMIFQYEVYGDGERGIEREKSVWGFGFVFTTIVWKRMNKIVFVVESIHKSIL